MQETMKAIMKRPGKDPKIVEIVKDLDVMRTIVGGELEGTTISRRRAVICNKHGYRKDLPYNCTIEDDELVGTILIVGAGDEDIEGLKDPEGTLKELFPLDFTRHTIEKHFTADDMKRYKPGKDGTGQIDPETYINAKKIKGKTEAFVTYRGAARDVFGIWFCALKEIAGNLIRDGFAASDIAEIMTAGTLETIEEIKKALEDAGKEG